MNSAVIVDAIRTHSGRGRSGGRLSEIHPTALLSRGRPVPDTAHRPDRAGDFVNQPAGLH